VDEQSIDIGYLKSYLSVRPQPPHAQVTAETIRQRLEELIVSEVLYQEALRLQLDRQPQMRWQIQQLLSQQLLEEKVNQPIRQKKITDTELRTYYRQHSQEYNRAAQVRLADIFVAVDPKATPEERKKIRDWAEEVLAYAKAIEVEASGFGELIEKYSDTHEKYPKGSTGFFDIKGEPIGVEVELAVEAFKLKTVGRICDHVIETPAGFHIVMLVGKRDAVHKPFNQVAEQIRKRISRERLEQARESYIKKLKEKSKITTDTKMVDQITEELKESLKGGSFSISP
jgi:peptidyl-prolyl cis-trans isomerase C